MSNIKAETQNFSESLLNDGHLLEIKMTGYSMFPALKGGEYALVEKCAPDEVKPGEIVVFRSANKLIAHRIHKIIKQNSDVQFITKGDNNSFFDKPFSGNELLGKVVSKKKSPNSEIIKIKQRSLINLLIITFPYLSTRLNHISQHINHLPNRIYSKSKRSSASFKFIGKGSEKLIIINSILSVLQGVLPFLLIVCIKWMVDYLTGDASVYSFHAIGFYSLIIIAAIVFFANGLVNELRTLWGERMLQSVVKQMYAAVQNKHLSLHLNNLENPAELDKIHRAVQESTFRPIKLINDGLQLLRSLASAVFLLVLFISIQWYIALILLLAVIPGILIRLKFARKQQQLKKVQSTTEREMFYFNRVLTALPFAKELRLFHFSDFFRKNFQIRQEKLHFERISIRRSEILQNIGSHLFTVVLIFVTLGWLSYLKMDGTITLGAVVLFLFSFQRGFTVLSDLLKSVTQILEDSSYLDEIMDFFAIPSIESVSKHRMTLNKGIRIENLSFSYKNSKRNALKNINLNIEAGKTVAIVGHNGSGKSTFIKLLCGFYEPSEGQIYFDNVSTTQLGQKAISENMAAVFQDFALYNVSAAQNIALGRLSDKTDYAKIVEAACAAGIDEVLQNLPKGYDTMLGNSFYGGEELSMGQWQKLAIARAFYRNADFIVMDEPSSALDVHAEQQIMKSVGKMTKNKTAVIISHRLSSVKWVDEIIVFREGEIIEQGNHNDLISKKGYYYELYQASKKDIID